MTFRVRAEMPEQPVRSRSWLVGAAGFALLGVWMFVAAFNDARHPPRRRGLTEWTFPTDEMFVFAAEIALELAIVIAVLSRSTPSSLGRRALHLGIVVFGVCVLWLPTIIHAVPPTPQFLLLQFLGALWLVVFGLTLNGLAARRVIR